MDEYWEEFRCRKLIDGKRCENKMLRNGLGDAFDYPECEWCQKEEQEASQKNIALEKDILEDMEVEIESGQLVKLPGGMLGKASQKKIDVV